MFKSLALIVISVLATAAQNPGSPILVDEFERVGCCEMGARLDGFFGELANNPTFVGLVVTAGTKDKTVAKVRREEMIRGYIQYRNFDPARVRFVRAESETLVTQLWRFPSGTAIPEFPGTDNTYALDLDKPTQLLVHYPSGDGGLCPPVEDREMFGLFLAANQTARARIIIRGYTRGQSNKIERELLQFFLKDQEIARTRLLFEHARRRDARGLGPSIEYWYLP